MWKRLVVFVASVSALTAFAQYSVLYQGREYRVPDSSYTHSDDGNVVWCGMSYSSYQHSLNGKGVCAGGNYSSYQHSLDGSNVACGGEYSSYQHSLDGSKVCTGGKYSSYQHSLNGANVSCGGHYSSYQHSMNGHQVCAGGHYAVLNIHKESSILREEVKWKILKEQGAPLAQTDVDKKEIDRDITKVKKHLVIAKEAQAKMVLNFHSGEIRADVYEVALQSSKQSLNDLEVKLANLELQKRGHEKDAKWVGWLKVHGKQIDAKNDLNEEDRKDYLSGLLREVKVKYLETKNLHELTLQFNLPIVDDGVNWNDPTDKKKGYTLKRGKKQTKVQLLGVERRGRKALPKNTPERD